MAASQLKKCLYCGAEITDEAPACWKCGTRQPDVPDATSVPADERHLMARELEIENQPKRTFEAIRGGIWWILVVAYCMAYELGLVPQVPGTFGRGDWIALSSLGLMLVLVLLKIVVERRAEATLNVLLLCIMAVGLVTLMLSNLGVLISSPFRIAALVVTAMAFVTWQGPKIAQKVAGALRRTTGS